MKSTIIFWTFCTVSTKANARYAFLLYKRVKRKSAGASPPEKALGTERALTLHTPPQRAAVPRRAAATTACARRGCAARYTPPAAPPAPVFRVYAARRYRRARYRGCTPRRAARPRPPGRFPIYHARRPLPGQRAAFARVTWLYARAAPGTPPATARRGTRPRPVRRARRVRRSRCRGVLQPQARPPRRGHAAAFAGRSPVPG